MFSTAHNVSLSDSPGGVNILVDGSPIATVGMASSRCSPGPPSPFKGMLLDPSFKIVVA